MDEVVIEKYVEGEWRKVADFGIYAKNDSAGYHARCRLSYDIDYVLSRMHHDRVVDRVGCRYPINFDNYESDSWPAFVLDLLPTGAAREAWLKMLGIRGDDSSWWQLLKRATGSPPGDLRIAGAAVEPEQHAGFEKKEIIEKNVDFIEYAEARGALVAGATDVQGQAPKFLLVQDRKGRWHAEGALPENQVKCHWLVKFPRGKTDADKLVLRNEAPYYEVARAFGLHTAAPLEYEDGALFVRRFDRRVTQEGIERFGLESITSICGISEFGLRGSHNEACRMIHRYASEPRREVLEYIKRDILNVALRNTDNHGRNTALLKSPSGAVALSPLFDFAPMFKDPEGIARAYRWDAEGEKEVGLPEWGRVAEALEEETGLPGKELRHWFADCAPEVANLPETMIRCGVEEGLVDTLSPRIQEVTRRLEEARPPQ